MTSRKDNALNLGGESGRKDQTKTDTATLPQAQTVSQSVDALIAWHRLGASVKPKVRRYGKSSASQQRDHHAIARQAESEPESGALYSLPKIRGGRHEE
jgi:hypothetical protein